MTIFLFSTLKEHWHRWFLIILLLLFYQANSIAQPTLSLNKKHFANKPLKSYLMIFCDNSGKLSMEEINQNYQANFTPLHNYNQSFNSEYAYWLKFKVTNTTKQFIPGILRLGVNDSLHVYMIQDSLIAQYMSGILTPYKSKPISKGWYDQVVPLELVPQSQITVFYRIKNLSAQAINSQATLLSNQRWQIHLQNQHLVQGIFQGVLSILFIIGVILFVATRERLYLFYFIQILGFVFTYLPNYGYLNFLVGSNLQAYIIWMVGSQVAGLFFVAFVREILNSRKQFPRLDYVLILLMTIRILALVIGSIILASNRSHSTVSLMVVIIDILSIMLGTWVIVYAYGKGNSFAKFLLSGAAVLIFGLALTVLATQGVIRGIFPDYFLQFGVLSQYLIFSIGLGKRIQENFQREKEAQIQILKMEQNAKQELERKVKERTLELSEANSEITTQNEELHQQHEEILAQRDFIENQNAELKQVNNQLKSSIRAAQNIQKAILPYQHELDHLLNDYFIIYRPKDVVSGDFYWISQVEDTQVSPPVKKTLLAAVDCTGHGVPGAFMSLIGHLLLDKIVNILQVADPALILTMLNDEIQKTLRQQDLRNDGGMDMAIIAMHRLANQDTHITFSGAKNSLFYIPAQTCELEVLRGTRKSIGGQIQNHFTFENQTVTLPKNSLIYLGSDGFTDQNNVQRKKYSIKQLVQLLEENCQSSIAQQQKALEESLETHMEETEQRDDILMIGVRL